MRATKWRFTRIWPKRCGSCNSTRKRAPMTKKRARPRGKLRDKRSERGPQRITILLGAGAVADAGLPTSVELASRFHHFLADRTAADEKHRLQLELHRFLDGGIRFQRGLLAQDPGE